jgi:hypothetical protein
MKESAPRAPQPQGGFFNVLTRLFRRSLIATVVSGVGVLGFAMAPASAATGGAVGAVVGTVGPISPGITLTCTPQTYSFAPITIEGAIAAGTQTAVGTITTSGISGGSTGCESTTGGNGTVGAFTLSSTLGVGTVSGSCTGGTYLRVGSIVLVNINCTINVNGTTTSLPSLAVVAQFTPTSGNGVTTPVTAANFAGAWGGTGS